MNMSLHLFLSVVSGNLMGYGFTEGNLPSALVGTGMFLLHISYFVYVIVVGYKAYGQLECPSEVEVLPAAWIGGEGVTKMELRRYIRYCLDNPDGGVPSLQKYRRSVQ